MTTELTPAGHRYIASLYASYVGSGLNLAEIRAAFKRIGVGRNLFQIEYDLEHRYNFAGYAAKHPAPAPMTFAELDAIEQAKATKTPRRIYAQPTHERIHA
jgi:hypothetical protein